MKSRIILSIAVAATLLQSCSIIKGNSGSSSKSKTLTQVTVDNDQTLAGRWYISTVGSHRLAGFADSEWPYLQFEPTESRFYGCNGCNVLNGQYTSSAEGSLTFGDVASTLRMCPTDTLEFPISRALAATRSYNVSGGTDVELTLLNEKNHSVMTLSKVDVSFLNGGWQVVAINGEACNNRDVRLVIDISEGHLHGNTGCNILNGSVTCNPTASRSVQFTALSTTRMACPEGVSESDLLIALEEVAVARPTLNNAVQLLDESGAEVIRLTPLTKEELRQSAE
jgi:heat shock protein HslJ